MYIPGSVLGGVSSYKFKIKLRNKKIIEMRWSNLKKNRHSMVESSPNKKKFLAQTIWKAENKTLKYLHPTEVSPYKKIGQNNLNEYSKLSIQVANSPI